MPRVPKRATGLCRSLLRHGVLKKDHGGGATWRFYRRQNRKFATWTVNRLIELDGAVRNGDVVEIKDAD